MSWARALRWAGLGLLFRMQIGAVYIYTFILLRRGLANVLTCHFSSAICSGNITHTCDGEAWTLAEKCEFYEEFDTCLLCLEMSAAERLLAHENKVFITSLILDNNPIPGHR